MITLNKISFINIKTPDMINKRIPFESRDVFGRTVKDNTKMSGDNNILSTFKGKSKGLPIGMDGVMNILGRYLSGDINCDEFAKTYLERTPVLFKRIEFGSNKEEYSQSYKPEITLIKEVNPLCAGYLNNSISKQNLDTSIYKLVDTYVKTEHKRGKLFIK